MNPAAQEEPSIKTHGKRHILFPLALALTVLAVFAGTASYQFVYYDDHVNVFENPYVRQGLSVESIQWALRAGAAERGPYSDYWMPLTWLSRMTDVEFYGLRPAGHHFVNVLLHVLNALMLYLMLRKGSGDAVFSLIAAYLFALHPVQAEPVSWVSSRKDVLSGFFVYASLYSYIWYAARRKLAWYAAAFVFFLFALMSKPVALCLPMLMIALDIFFSGNAGPDGVKPSWKHMLPFFAVSLLYLPLPFYSQNAWGGVSFEAPLRFIESAVWYLGKIFYPAGLGLYGPEIAAAPPVRDTVFSLGVLLVLTAAAVFFRRRMPWLLAGWLWYLSALAPAGLAETPANRFLYLPLAGLSIAAAWTLKRLISPRLVRYLPAVLIPFFIFMTWLTQRHADQWRDTKTLFESAVRINPENYLAYVGLGNISAQEGKFTKALEFYAKSLELNPGYIEAHHNRGTALEKLGRQEEAAAEFAAALEKNPDFAKAHLSLGNFFFNRKEFDKAEVHYREAIEADPYYLNARFNLGTVYAWNNQPEKALEQFETVLKHDPHNRQVREALEMVKAMRRKQPAPVS